MVAPAGRGRTGSSRPRGHGQAPRYCAAPTASRTRRVPTCTCKVRRVESSLLSEHPSVGPLLTESAQRAKVLEGDAAGRRREGLRRGHGRGRGAARARVARHVLRAVRLQGGLPRERLPARLRGARGAHHRGRARGGGLARGAARSACARTCARSRRTRCSPASTCSSGRRSRPSARPRSRASSPAIARPSPARGGPCRRTTPCSSSRSASTSSPAPGCAPDGASPTSRTSWWAAPCGSPQRRNHGPDVHRVRDRLPRRAARVVRREPARRGARGGGREPRVAARLPAPARAGRPGGGALADRVRRPRRDADGVGDLLGGARARPARRCRPTCSASCSPARRS